MKTSFVFIILIFCSCTPQLNFQKKEFSVVDEIEGAEYWISSGNPEGKNLVFLFPDNLDSIDWESNSLLKSLKKENFKIVIPQLIGKKESLQTLLDGRTRRIKTINNLYNKLISNHEIDSLANVVLIGFGEGAYILPYLSNYLPRVNNFFMVNAGLGSPLSEMQLLVSEGDDSFLNTPKMRYFGMDDLDELKRTIREVDTYPEFDIRLGNKTNFYWKEFYTYPTDQDLSLISTRGNIILSQDYPFMSKTSKNELFLINGSNPLTTLLLHNIEGKGDFRIKEEMDLLKEYILDNIN